MNPDNPKQYHCIVITIEGDDAEAVIHDLTAKTIQIITPDRERTDYKDGPKWSGRDEWLGDFWAKVRDNYDS